MRLKYQEKVQGWLAVLLQRRLQPLGSVQLVYTQIQGPQRRPDPEEVMEFAEIERWEKLQKQKQKGEQASGI